MGGMGIYSSKTDNPLGERMKGLEDLEKGYLVAFLEAEGCMSVLLKRDKRGRNSMVYHPFIQFTNTNQRIMEWLGGVLEEKVMKRKARSIRHKPCYVIQFFGHVKIANFLEPLLPYFKFKQEIATLLLDFCKRRIYSRKHGKHSRGRNVPYTKKEVQICEKVRLFNRRGLSVNS